MKILFMMERRENAGSIQAIASYIRVGHWFGHTIALYGRPDPRFPRLRWSTEVGAFDYVVIVLESGLNWLSGVRLPTLLDAVPRSRRVILDADGMCNRLISVDGYDRNHANERARRQWRDACALLADTIFQPTLSPEDPNVAALPFYGYDPSSRLGTERAPEKVYDLLHVGHNWWRWRDVSARVLPALERLRPRMGRVCFMGSWWDHPPLVDDSLAIAFRSDQRWFERLDIQIEPAVPYTNVIRAMSTARVNLMTQRPLFQRLRLLTSKYFEVFAADTIPLVLLDLEHAASVYGPAGRELALHNGIEERLLDVLQRPRRYREIVEAVREHLEQHHSYPVRVQQLVAALEGARLQRGGPPAAQSDAVDVRLLRV